MKSTCAETQWPGLTAGESGAVTPLVWAFYSPPPSLSAHTEQVRVNEGSSPPVTSHISSFTHYRSIETGSVLFHERNRLTTSWKRPLNIVVL